MKRDGGDLHRKWIEQCEAARDIRGRYGVESAFDYLVSEKLLSFAEIALNTPELAHQLPGFVSAVRQLFSQEEIEVHWPRLERQLSEAADAEIYALEQEMVDATDAAALADAKEDAARLREGWIKKTNLALTLRDLLTRSALGTG